MTRLRIDDIADIAKRLPQYDAQLTRQTGQTLKGVACHALGIRKEYYLSRADRMKVSVVPFSCGHGVISEFAHTVAQIADYMGFAAFVTERGDVRGLADAFRRNADIIFMADDRQFAAVNLHTRRVSDNGEM
ncbi:MAG TPA: 3-methylornithyl-N6-L-lysine dehydrogenase PylD, partial [Desulfobacterales bacterium]|nr:3-methylornithyl-N6-L-lysine dehydrogenase PylD [Desulfobacterales bacterium]